MDRAFKILVAEDEPFDQVFLQRAFKRVGLEDEVLYVSDGQKAVDYLKKVGPENVPKILLVDIKMPRMNGFELMEWVGRQRSLDAMRIVVLTSSELPTDFTHAADLGANEYHLKPHDMEGLLRLAEGLKFYLKTQAALARMNAAPQRE